MEMVFRISNYLAENQVKFATCTLLAGALTWWNSYVRIVGTDATYVMTWIELKKKMADKYCPRNKMKKIESPCIPRCYKCNKIGHLARDCKSLTNANVANNQRGNRAGQKATCYECEAQGHFKRKCPKLKNNNNNNRGNQVGTGNAQAR
nr:reverse transcriptase domain-containing protein [Tanacetum cinerariifolium]